MSAFPALPQPLRAWLGSFAVERDQALERDVDPDARATFVPLREFSDKARMSDDGFHPGPIVYDEWAARVVDAILEHVSPRPGVAD